MLRVLDLFSGIGGFSLGLERTGGFQTVAFCEIEPFPRAVLAKHWPEVPCYDDVRTLTGARLAADGVSVDVICGGFPCQDISLAGKGAGLGGERSGLWSEYARLVSEVRPRWVVIENVSALRSRGLDEVLGTLSALGFDAEWHCIPASAVGAPHRRDRVWIVAHSSAMQRIAIVRHEQDGVAASSGDVADVLRPGPHAGALSGIRPVKKGAGPRDVQSPGRSGARRSEDVADANFSGLEVVFDRIAGKLAATIGASSWPAEPNVGRVAHGVPRRVDRLRALGNAVVPQIPEAIGRAILAVEAERQREAA